MSWKALFWTLLLIVLTVMKVVITILITTVKTILVKNDWLWVEVGHMIVSFVNQLFTFVVDLINMLFSHVLATLLYDITNFIYGIFSLVVSLLSKAMTISFWIVRYVVSRWREISFQSIRKANLTEESTLALDDRS
ncbi:uncharacterized protein [Macrobrachium rosenbergii]|uniref:uncharacterized protein n=1 Tax=Macrobrachium rosenbergii TaxID=79674 RepID=UPI0034D7148A